MNHPYTLYFIAGRQDFFQHKNPELALLDCLEQALKAGITCYQFRDKGEKSFAQQKNKQIALAQKARKLCAQYQIPFIINDEPELAIATNADGIHIGQEDGDPKHIKQSLESALKKTIILGQSTNKLEEALKAQQNPSVDYLGIGPIYATQSKKDSKTPCGANIIQTLKNHHITKPIIAIGGITEQTAQELRKKGADGIAIISAITQSNNKSATIKALLK